MHLAPSEGDHVEPTVEVWAAVLERGGAVPLHERGGVPRPALHPYVVDLEVEIGQDSTQALEPTAQGFYVVAFAPDRVGAAEAVMDIWRGGFQQLVIAMAVDVVEALSDQLLDEIAVEHGCPPVEKRKRSRQRQHSSRRQQRCQQQHVVAKL